MAERGARAGRAALLRDPRVIPLPPAAHLTGMLLAALPVLLYVYLPRPPVPGSQFLAYPAMGGLLGALALLLLRDRPVVDRAIVGWLLLLLAYSVVTGVSFIVNAPELRGSAPFELVRPLLFGVFLLYGYLVGSRVETSAIHRGLLWAAGAVLLGQAVVAATQLVGLSPFGILYEDDKSRPIGMLLRATGTLANPNAFAWMVAQSAVVISILGRGSWRWAWLALATVLMLVSGSRTLLLLFPLMLATAEVLRDPTNLRTYLRYGAVAAVLLLLFAGVILYLGEYFPYLAQLSTVLSSGSLASVNSFAIRLGMWESRLAEFSAGGAIAWVVGLGSRPSTAVLDSDFLYVFVRLGVLGVLVHYTMIVAAATGFLRSRRAPVAIIGLEYLLFGLVFGLVAETLASWHLPLVLFALLGLVIGSGRCGDAGIRAPAAATTHRRSARAPSPPRSLPAG